MTVLIISLVTLFLFFLGSPVVLVVAVWVAATSFLVAEYPLASMGVTALDSLKNYALLGLPLFVATGDLLTEAGISRRLLAFSRSLVAWLPGATAATAILASGIFAAISGSNAATAATMARLAGPDLIKTGMRPSLAAAIVAAGGTLGIVIPPSIIFVVYGITVNVSPIDLFLGGVIPGLIMVLFLMIACVWKTRGLERSRGFRSGSATEVAQKAVEAWVGLVPIGLMLLGISFGWFSPTEAAGVATIYSLIAGMFVKREFSLRRTGLVLSRSASVAGLIVPLVVFSIQLQQVLSILQIGNEVQEFVKLIPQESGPLLLVLFMLCVLLMAGAIMESVALVIILGPILAPIAANIGFDPVHWGVIFVVGTSIGFITPPYGLNLFVVSAAFNVPYGKVVREIGWLLVPLVLAWGLVVLAPWTTNFLAAR